MTSAEHRKKAPRDLYVKIITVSDSLKTRGKGKEEDESGDIIQKKLEERGYSSERIIISEEDEEIRKELSKSSKNSEIDALITTGGTGITSRDRTVDVAKDLFEMELPGFGELMGSESYEEVDKAAFLSRTTAGILNKKPFFVYPALRIPLEME